MKTLEEKREYRRKYYLLHKEEECRNMKRWQKEHPEKVKKWIKIHRLHTTRGYVYTKKRVFKGICELCRNKIKIGERSIWHHWDSNHPEWGIWLHYICHVAVEASERYEFIIPQYEELKFRIVNGLV